MKTDTIIFALSSNKKLAKKLSETLNIPLGKCEVERFSDGEIITRCLDDVNGKKVYIVQSTVLPATEKVFEIVLFCDALKNMGANEIVLINPYSGYSRQDRVAKFGEPLSARVVADLFVNSGIKEVITIDLHTPTVEGFYRVPVVNIVPSKLFADYYRDYFSKEGISLKDVAVVSPDHGSINRAEGVARYLNEVGVIYVEKHRPAPNQSKVISFRGDIAGKTCLLIDDIIDTGGTINNVVDKLFEHGAKEVCVAGTHPIFSKGKLDSRIKKIVVTDTIEKEIEGVEVIGVANLIAPIIE